MRALVYISTALFMSACSTVAIDLKDDTFYKRDIDLKVNGLKSNGVAVMTRAQSYKIEGEVDGKFDFLIVRSCHREYTAEKEGDHFTFIYEPRVGIEDNRPCPLEIRGVEKIKGRHSFGMIDFQSPYDILPAELECNGDKKTYSGVSICQAPENLIQRVTFSVPVYVQAGTIDPSCVIEQAKDLKIYEFKIPPKRCTFIFMEKAEPHRTHRMTTLGYERIIVREF